MSLLNKVIKTQNVLREMFKYRGYTNKCNFIKNLHSLKTKIVEDDLYYKFNFDNYNITVVYLMKLSQKNLSTILNKYYNDDEDVDELIIIINNLAMLDFINRKIYENDGFAIII